MLYNPKVEIVRYRQITTEDDCKNAFGTHADAPAVYAWFRDITLSPAVLTSKDEFINTVLQLFDKPLSEKRESRINPFYEVGLTIKPKRLTPTKERALRHYATNEDVREEIGKALEAMIFWQVPLYVGKAKRLVDRVLDHVNRETDLANRLETMGLGIQDCLLAYMPISYRDEEKNRFNIFRTISRRYHYKIIHTRICSTPWLIKRKENSMSNNGIEDIVSQPRNEYTEPLFFIPGKYTLSQVGQVPYFSSVMPLEDLVEQIKLVENILEDTELTVSLEGLFQRDINWDRVKDEIVNGYLKQQNKLNFFNSLTIALLPGTGSKIEDDYGDPEYIPSPTYKNKNWKKIDVGNICVEFNSDDSLGVLRWHKKRVFPVAIDGQHRLAALKEYCKDLTTENPPELNTKVPIIFLILDKDIGFEGRQGKSLIETLREIFIDLNKHARVVSKSRLILLDDLNIQSFCVRTLLDSDEKDSYPEVLPLSMVTWRENDIKFDTGYSITTVLNLNEIVDSCLSGASLDGPSSLEENEVKKYIDKIKGKLELSGEVQESINNHLRLCTNRVQPFGFEDGHLDAFKEAFRSQWTPHIVRVFREFAPYAKFLSTAQEIGAIDGTFSNYLLKSKENRDAHRKSEEEKDNKFDPVEKIDLPLDQLIELKKNEWAFYVVFQKALFINFFWI